MKRATPPIEIHFMRCCRPRIGRKQKLEKARNDSQQVPPAPPSNPYDGHYSIGYGEHVEKSWSARYCKIKGNKYSPHKRFYFVPHTNASFLIDMELPSA